MALTSKQIEFCKLISLGKSGTKAYAAAFKSKSPTTNKVNASKLLKRAEIASEVNRLKELNREIVKNANQKAADKVSEFEIATVAERMDILTKICRGDIVQVITRTVEGVSVEYQETPSFTDRKNAIAELNKMDGSYTPVKNEVKIDAPLALTINATPDIAKGLDQL